MKNYGKNKESSNLKYWDVNNIYGWPMSQKFSVNGFKWVEDLFELDGGFVKSYHEKGKERCFIEVDSQHLENLHNVQSDLPFLPDRIKIQKVEKLVANLHEKNEYVLHIRNLKQTLNHGFVLKKKNHRIIKFNEKAWLKSYMKNTMR